MRGETNQHIDQKIFRRTAASTKAVNLGVRLFRGGFRF